MPRSGDTLLYLSLRWAVPGPVPEDQCLHMEASKHAGTGPGGGKWREGWQEGESVLGGGAHSGFETWDSPHTVSFNGNESLNHIRQHLSSPSVHKGPACGASPASTGGIRATLPSPEGYNSRGSTSPTSRIPTLVPTTQPAPTRPDKKMHVLATRCGISEPTRGKSPWLQGSHPRSNEPRVRGGSKWPPTGGARWPSVPLPVPLFLHRENPCRL